MAERSSGGMSKVNRPHMILSRLCDTVEFVFQNHAGMIRQNLVRGYGLFFSGLRVAAPPVHLALHLEIAEPRDTTIRLKYKAVLFITLDSLLYSGALSRW
jgi:hypothetical protein